MNDMEESLARYVRYLVAERNASPHTVSNYSREIRQFMEFANSQGCRAWVDVTPVLLRRWLAALHAAGYVKPSVARRLSELRAFYSYLHLQRAVTDNPARVVSSPKLPQRLPRPSSVRRSRR